MKSKKPAAKSVRTCTRPTAAEEVHDDMHGAHDAVQENRHNEEDPHVDGGRTAGDAKEEVQEAGGAEHEDLHEARGEQQKMSMMTCEEPTAQGKRTCTTKRTRT